MYPEAIRIGPKGDCTAGPGHFAVGTIGGVGYETKTGLSISRRLNRGLIPLRSPVGTTLKLRQYNDGLLLQRKYLLPFDHKFVN